MIVMWILESSILMWINSVDVEGLVSTVWPIADVGSMACSDLLFFELSMGFG